VLQFALSGLRVFRRVFLIPCGTPQALAHLLVRIASSHRQISQRVSPVSKPAAVCRWPGRSVPVVPRSGRFAPRMTAKRSNNPLPPHRGGLFISKLAEGSAGREWVLS
jgi:hypothetical protein